ncbi:MAG TPA: cobalamin biosynthesis protein [Mycobacteriales bacterium]|nr:cobalamin biosynthesis protein [Mycobacteriales bacterium]
MRSSWPSAAGIAGGLGLDALLGDPRRGHPVAAFGTVAARTERVLHRDSRAAGAAYTALLGGGTALLGTVVARRAQHPVVRVALTAAATWSVVGGTSLRREALAMHALLRDGDVEGARARLPHLCGRDPAGLGPADLARATVESVAENTSDAVVGPLLWGAVAGVPGLVGYRAVNTLDAMVGHRSPRYARFGWASARLDDAANLAPARITAGLATVLAPLVGGRPEEARRVWVRDGYKHPSPNAGPVEAAFAGALGRTLGGRLSYAGRVEDRPLLGNGPAPDVADIPRAARLSTGVGLAAGVLAVGVRGLVVRRSRR